MMSQELPGRSFLFHFLMFLHRHQIYGGYNKISFVKMIKLNWRLQSDVLQRVLNQSVPLGGSSLLLNTTFDTLGCGIH